MSCDTETLYEMLNKHIHGTERDREEVEANFKILTIQRLRSENDPVKRAVLADIYPTHNQD